LKKNGLNLAFQAIFSEIVTKKVEKEQVFVYTAMRLRQIGNDLNSMQKVFFQIFELNFLFLFRKKQKYKGKKITFLSYSGKN